MLWKFVTISGYEELSSCLYLQSKWYILILFTAKKYSLQPKIKKTKCKCTCNSIFWCQTITGTENSQPHDHFIASFNLILYFKLFSENEHFVISSKGQHAKWLTTCSCQTLFIWCSKNCVTSQFVHRLPLPWYGSFCMNKFFSVSILKIVTSTKICKKRKNSHDMLGPT